MHHEFAHILHQTKNYDPAFDRITENAYIGSDWYMVGANRNAWQQGFVTSYAMSESREDFVENIAVYVTNTEDTGIICYKMPAKAVVHLSNRNSK